MDDLLREFLTETSESLAVLDVELVTLEQTPNDPALLGSIFRIVHTIKGTCGFLRLPRLEAVTHAAENVLGKYRDGELEITSESISLILASLDSIKGILSALETTECEPEGDDAHLIACLDAVAAGDHSAALVMPDHLEGMPPPAANAVDENASDRNDSREPAATPGASEASGAERSAEDGAAGGITRQTIRVQVDLLENLMTMVSELVLTRNQLLQVMRDREDPELSAPLQRLNHVTSELQEGVMKTRMQPIGNAWAKLPRIVRDLGQDLGKNFELTMRGEDTELDRQLLELIRDPLTHMVRNACDHGIETPEDRVRAGKPDTGRIVLAAHHEGGHIIIRIADDGRGLAYDRIRAKAVAKGIVPEHRAASMSDQQVQQLVFSPGFSTVEEVTSVSGRGVGMDVVKTNIEKIGGTVELASIDGRGSTFTIKIPLTLAIVNALILESAGERFAIPQINVIELVRGTEGPERRIERINGVPVLRLRDRLLPLVSLRELLQLESGGDDGENACDRFIVICRVGTYSYGIIVDKVFDTEEIVVKPVAGILRELTMFSGNTILGDGSVIMILDPNGIAAATGEVAAADVEAEDANAGKEDVTDQRVALLLFRAGEGAPKAVPLSLIARLEEIAGSSIEQANGRPVVQYRDQLMPLAFAGSSRDIDPETRLPVIVFAERGRSIGLVVEEIVDIVEDELSVEVPAGNRTGLLGSSVVAGKATDIIDVAHCLSEAFPDWFDAGGRAACDEVGQGTSRILLVDDSPFFRNLLSPLLRVAGYEVTTARSGDEAMEICISGDARFDVVISDIEMPGMNGFEFAQTLRSTRGWEETPIVALSSFATPQDLERGRAAGFSDYVAKFDREALLESLSQTIANRKGAA